MRTLVRLLTLSLVPLLAGRALADVDAVTLLRAGLGAEALAAAGVTSGEVAGTVADVEASDAALNGDLATADGALASAKATAAALRKVVKSGSATEQEKADYLSAKAAVLSAEAAVDAVLEELFDSGTADLSAAEKATLATLQANVHRRKFAIELRVVSRTAEQWLDLGHALDHEKVCIEDGEEVHADVASLLATARSAAAVAQAKANLDANLASVQAAWDAAVD